MGQISRLSRPMMKMVAGSIHERLVERQAKGPPEPGLDAFIVDVGDVNGVLGTHVTGHTAADATRVALVDKLDQFDDQVDRWLRHLDGYLLNESLCRRSPYAAAAESLRKAALPLGRGPVDDHVVDENEYCRHAITILKAPEHADTLKAIEMPIEWTAKLESAVASSQATFDELTGARGEKGAHIDLGRDAEVVFTDVMTRLRKYIGSRAKRGDTAKELEGTKLLEPLTAAIQKMKTEAALRSTLDEKKKAEAPAGAKPAEGGGDKPA